MKQIAKSGQQHPRDVSSRQALRSHRMAMLVVLVVCSVQPAYAYLDPGTGSLILQGLIAAVAGAMVYAGMYWRRIKSFFSPKSRAEAETPPESDQPPEDPHN